MIVGQDPFSWHTARPCTWRTHPGTLTRSRSATQLSGRTFPQALTCARRKFGTPVSARAPGLERGDLLERGAAQLQQAALHAPQVPKAAAPRARQARERAARHAPPGIQHVPAALPRAFQPSEHPHACHSWLAAFQSTPRLLQLARFHGAQQACMHSEPDQARMHPHQVTGQAALARHANRTCKQTEGWFHGGGPQSQKHTCCPVASLSAEGQHASLATRAAIRHCVYCCAPGHVKHSPRNMQRPAAPNHSQGRCQALLRARLRGIHAKFVCRTRALWEPTSSPKPPARAHLHMHAVHSRQPSLLARAPQQPAAPSAAQALIQKLARP